MDEKISTICGILEKNLRVEASVSNETQWKFIDCNQTCNFSSRGKSVSFVQCVIQLIVFCVIWFVFFESEKENSK